MTDLGGYGVDTQRGRGAPEANDTRVGHHEWIVDVLVPYLRSVGRSAYIEDAAKDLGRKRVQVSCAIATAPNTIKSCTVSYKNASGKRSKRTEIRLAKGL